MFTENSLLIFERFTDIPPITSSDYYKVVPKDPKNNIMTSSYYKKEKVLLLY